MWIKTKIWSQPQHSHFTEPVTHSKMSNYNLYKKIINMLNPVKFVPNKCSVVASFHNISVTVPVPQLGPNMSSPVPWFQHNMSSTVPKFESNMSAPIPVPQNRAQQAGSCSSTPGQHFGSSVQAQHVSSCSCSSTRAQHVRSCSSVPAQQDCSYYSARAQPLQHYR